MLGKRNIVMVTYDSLRADHCSFMGYERETTPALDKMAKNGLFFKNAIAAGIGTPASMTCTFTGDYVHIDPSETSPEPWRRILSGRKTLAQVLSKKGYRTGAFNPNVFASRYFGFDKGFNYFQDFVRSGGVVNSIYYRILDRVTKSGKKGLASALRNIRNLIQRQEIFKPWEDYYDQIMGWVETCDSPFFLWVLLLDTHHPYLAPKKSRQWSGWFGMWYSNWKLQKVNWEAKLSEKERKNLINAYDDSIYYADKFLDRLWKDLRDKEPILIIHSDHGEAFGEHNVYGHRLFIYEEFIHVPLVIYNCGMKREVEECVSLIGLAPTIMELIGEKNEFYSESFLYRGKDWVISKVYKEGKSKIAVRMKDWKFITGQKDEDELYYLKEDPCEQVNLIGERSGLVQEMKKIVKCYVRNEGKKWIRDRVSRLRDVQSICKI